jgi:type I restriction enzyme M protein
MGNKIKTLKEYFNEFDKKNILLEKIDCDWYLNNCYGVISHCNSAKTRDSKGNFSEEYIRARFVWGLISSGMYQKEYICVEFSFPKGNTKTTLKPDVVVFKNRDWLIDFKEAKKK